MCRAFAPRFDNMLSIERYHIEWKSFVDNHTAQEELYGFGHIEADPVQDLLTRFFDNRNDPNLNCDASSEDRHLLSIRLVHS